MKLFPALLATVSASALALPLPAAQLPTVAVIHGTSQLLVDGQPYLIFGGELGNSSAGTAAQADTILPRVAAMHANTVLLPVPWDEIEPEEGRFDYTIPDHWMAVARAQHLHLVFLWFGAWKNAFSNYAPAWVRADTRRFPRAISADGVPTEILSTLSPATQQADSHALAALMEHLRATDAAQQTVLMVQVENEVGFLGRGGRDRSPEANRRFADDVPPALMHGLVARSTTLGPEPAAHFNPQGRTWAQVFGESADEAFMAWHYAIYMNAVAEAGKRAYALPMYVNTQLPAPLQTAGSYPSGGPSPYNLDIYRVAAPEISFFSPDIYYPDFEYWINRYRLPGNAVFVPEARGDAAPGNALYAYGEARAFGFSAFDVEDLATTPSAGSNEPATLQETYAALGSLGAMLPQAQLAGHTGAVVLHAAGGVGAQTLALGGYLFDASLARAWRSGTLEAQNGAMLVLESAPDEFYIIGSGLHLSIYRDPDTDDRIAGIVSVEQVSRANGDWKVDERLTGDQDDQGRQILMDAHRVHVYRVRLYTYPRR